MKSLDVVLVGTTNELKLDAVRAGFLQAGLACVEVRGVEAASGVNEQPVRQF